MKISDIIAEYQKTVRTLLIKYNVEEVNQIPNVHEGAIALTLNGVISVLLELRIEAGELIPEEAPLFEPVLVLKNQNKDTFEKDLCEAVKKGYGIHTVNITIQDAFGAPGYHAVLVLL